MLPQLNTRLHRKDDSNRSTSILQTIIVVVALPVSVIPFLDSNTYNREAIKPGLDSGMDSGLPQTPCGDIDSTSFRFTSCLTYVPID